MDDGIFIQTTPPPVDQGLTLAQRNAIVPDLRRALNRNGIDGVCETPDWVLAEMLADVLDATAKAVRRREQWFGRR